MNPPSGFLAVTLRSFSSSLLCFILRHRVWADSWRASALPDGERGEEDMRRQDRIERDVDTCAKTRYDENVTPTSLIDDHHLLSASGRWTGRLRYTALNTVHQIITAQIQMRVGRQGLSES